MRTWLVCGGRDYNKRDVVWARLDELVQYFEGDVR